jgi:penicillin-binding protein 2
MSELGGPQEELREVQRRLTILKFGLILVVALLALRFWQLQIREGSYYQDLSENNRTRTVAVEPARGLIYDRNGVLLANNVPSFNLYVTLEDLTDREVFIRRVVDLIGLDEAMLRKKLAERGPKLTPRKIKGGLTLREAALIESHRLDLPGLMIQAESQRNYPQAVTAAHLLGYVGEISADQLEKTESKELRLGSIIGQYGVEKSYDAVLRGQPGEKLTEVDALGHQKRTVMTEKPQAGDNLYLTIDQRLQTLAEDLLGPEAGAIVALDPTSGEVLALASRPTFDPNVLSREMTPKRWDEIVTDEGHPLTNRATQGQYPPGSTFKIVMAAAALETDTVEPGTRIPCAGMFQFGRRQYRDWKKGGHGLVDLRLAIVDSCDVYFYTIGHRLGIDTIASYATQFGLGRNTGIELPSERLGIVPSTTWKAKARGESWLPGETISASIGQGYLTVTPIQMATLIGTVGNDGISYQPRLVKAVLERGTGQLRELAPTVRGRITASRDTFRLIREALAGVVTEGTARRAHSLLVSIAGKTGTAQTAALREGPEEDIPKKFRDHAWFVSYAPVDTPRIAVAVLVEHMGHGGSAAAPLAKQVIEAYIKFYPQPLVADHSSSGPREAQVALRGLHD